MFIQSLKYDYQTGGILVEYVTKGEAREMTPITRAIRQATRSHPL